RAGLLAPERGPRGELLFTFQDMVLLQTAKGLLSAHIAPRKIRGALQRLKEQLPSDRPLTGLRIAADGDSILVRDGERVWNVESGQVLFDFEVDELARKIAPLQRTGADETAAKSK